MDQESSKTERFFYGVKRWPKAQSELESASELVLDVLNVQFVAIGHIDRTDSVGVKIENSWAQVSNQIPLLIEFLKNQSRILPEGKLQPIQFECETLPGISRNGPSYVAMVAIPALIREDAATSQIHRKVGWIAAGMDRPFKSSDESILLAIAMRFGSLAELAHLDTELQLRSQFLSIASHELKTPLTSIYGMLQLEERMAKVKREPSQADRERSLSYLRIIIRQVRRLNELIDGLLDLSRIQNGRFMVEPSDSDLAVILRDTVESRLRMIAQEASVQIQLDVPPQCPARLDPVRTEELISNLVMNAIRFSPEGGVVFVKLQRNDDGFRLTVRDQGPSISIEDRERIFQPYERLQRTGRFGGLGLGLFIARQIAQLHGGNVSLVESVPGKGNVFEAYIPAHQARVTSVVHTI